MQGKFYQIIGAVFFIMLAAGCVDEVSDARAGLTNDCSDCIDDTGGDTGGNNAPVAYDGTAITNEDEAVTVNLTGIDGDGDAIVYAIDVPPAYGTLSGTGDTRTYTPNADFSGEDGFAFKASDGIDESLIATITITVTPVNDPPTAAVATISTAEDTPSAGVVAEVTDIDLDYEGDTHSLAIATQPDNGSASVADNQLVYTPEADFNGADSFTFTATDSGGESVTGTATVTVAAVNDAPTITGSPPATATEDVDYAFTPASADVDLEREGDTLAYSISNKPDWAEFDTATGVLSGRPANLDGGAFTGIVIAVTDAALESASLPPFDLTVVNTNDPPTAVSATILMDEGTASAGVDPTVDDIDLASYDGDSHTFSIGGPTAAANGTASVNAGNQLVYTPTDPEWSGSDSFTFTATDSGGEEVTGIATVTVAAVNDAPSATSADITTGEDTTSVGVDAAVTDVDLDNEGDSHNFFIQTQGANGTASIVGNQLVYTPDPDFCCADSFTFKAKDEGGLYFIGTANVTITPVNDDPTATSAAITITEDIANAGEVPSVTDVDLANEGDTHNFTIIGMPAPAGGVASVNGSNQLVYTPNVADFCCSDSFGYRATDSGGGWIEATVNVTINAANDPPTAATVSITTAEDTASAGVAPTVTDPDDGYEGDSYTIIAVSGGTNGTPSFTASQLFYTPTTQDYFGGDSFTFTVQDGGGNQYAGGAATVTVTAVNDGPVADDQPALTTAEEAGGGGWPSP